MDGLPSWRSFFWSAEPRTANIPRATEAARAQAFGDAILAALENDEASDRVAALDQITAPTEEGAAVLDMLTAAEEGIDGNGAAAAERLNATATNGELPEIYRQIASFKALTRPETTLAAEERRVAFEAMASPAGRCGCWLKNNWRFSTSKRATRMPH